MKYYTENYDGSMTELLPINSNYIIFATFGNNTVLHRKFQLYSNRYISVNGQEPNPIEDWGDYMLFDTEVKEDEAAFEWAKTVDEYFENNTTKIW